MEFACPLPYTYLRLTPKGSTIMYIAMYCRRPQEVVGSER